jgi:imidazolonepropionase-like amidohydrolase
MWLVPGVYDCHSHISWGDFHREDREARSPEEQLAQARDALAATLRGGVTNLRDAGGADAALRDAVADGSLIGPRLQISVDMIGADDAGSVSSVRAAVARALDKGATWIKLVATTGVATPADSLLDSIFNRAEFAAAVDAAHEGDARVMVHTWGGDSIDWAIEAGATSIEHGIYMTSSQATRAHDAGMKWWWRENSGACRLRGSRTWSPSTRKSFASPRKRVCLWRSVQTSRRPSSTARTWSR